MSCCAVQRSKFNLRLGIHTNTHPGMLGATILGTSSQISSGNISLQPKEIWAAGDRIQFAAELGNPPIVNYVGGFQAHQ